MEQWLRGLIDSAVGGLRGLIDAVWERITWVYNVFVTLGYALRDAWNVALQRIRHFKRSIDNFALQIALTLYWIAWIRIPQEIGRLATDFTHWASQQIQAARNFARSIVDELTRWVVARLNDVRSFIDSVTRWVVTKFAEVTAAIKSIGTLVYQFLTDPSRLAEWILGALLAALWRHVDRNLDRIMLYMRERAIHHTMYFAARIESLLERLI